MKSISPVTVVLAVVQIMANAGGLLACGGIRFIVFIFSGKADSSADWLVHIAMFMFHILTGLSLLYRLRVSLVLALMAGIVGIMSTLQSMRQTGFRQPDIAYLMFFAVYLGWFLSLLLGKKRTGQPCV